MNSYISIAADLIFPRRCPFCDELLPFGGRLVCSRCEPLLPRTGRNYCLKCGRQLKEGTDEYCPSCRKVSHAFDEGRSLFVYDDRVRRSLAAFKYKNRREYADYYSEELYRKFGTYIRSKRPDALIPVPVSPLRRRRRGYNQAELLAEKLGKLCKIPVKKDLILRVRETTALKELGRRQRQKNLKKAFKIRGNVVELKTIMVIDDIYTTGSTMDEISSVFREAGVRHVFFLTVASTGGL